MQPKDDAASRMYPPRPLVGVGAIITDAARVVLIKRGHEPSQGEWSIPGGLVSVGETLKEATAREALEETGLYVRPVGLVELLERIFHDSKGRVQYHYVLADYRCEVLRGSLNAGSDAAEARWFDRADLSGLKLADITLSVILKALDQ